MRIFATLAALLLPSLVIAQGLPSPVAEALKRAQVPLEAVSLVVREAGGRQALISHNPGKVMNPASVMKLVTTTAALDLLGPAFTFKTEFLVKGEIANGVLAGDLIIKGGGDPKLTYERLWAGLRQLRERGVREIRGDILIDRSYFAPLQHDPAKFDEKPKRAYNVGPDAFLVNFKVITLRFIPEASGVRVVADPPLASIDIASRIKLTKTGYCGDWQERLSLDVKEAGLLATLFVEGNFPEVCGERSWHVSVFDHAHYSDAMLRWLWSEAGGKLLGKIRSGEVPAEAKTIMTLESPPLSDLVRDVNKFSNNVMARQLFLALSAERDQQPGSAHRSTEIIREWLQSRGVEAPELVMENGAGLSRIERLSAASIAELLSAVWRRGPMPELVASLSLVGADGTFRKRNGSNGGSAHLKGGTLNDVRAVAGYVLDKKERRWIVAFIVNHANAPGTQAAQDALLTWLSER